LGYNYGAGKLDRALRAVYLSLAGASVISTGAFLVMLLFPKEIFSLFTSDVSLVSLGARTLRTMGMGFALVGLQVAGTGVFQAVGKGLVAFMLSLSRQVFLFIPLLLLLPPVLGLKGVWLAFPLSDLMSAAITAGMLVPHLNAMRDR
jgi:Na+-driven multidrug efflux pump